MKKIGITEALKGYCAPPEPDAFALSRCRALASKYLKAKSNFGHVHRHTHDGGVQDSGGNAFFCTL